MKYKSLIAAFIAAMLLYVSVFAQSTITGTVTTGANLRAGPGTKYAVAGALKAGQSITIVGSSSDKAWYHLDDGHWVFSTLIKVVGTVTPAATPTVTGTRPTSTPTATFTVTPTPTKTSIPTNTPLPTNTAIATIDPLSELKDSIASAVATCDCSFSTVEFDTDGDSEGKMVVRFIDKAAPDDSISSVDSFNLTTGLKIFYTLQAISKLNVNYDAIAFEFEVPIVDKYGNASVEQGISCYFSQATVKKINYPNIRMRYIVDLADRAYINPVLKENN